MSKVTAQAILTREALPDAPDEQWVDTILENTNSFQDQVRTVLQNGLSIGDNTPWKFQDYNLKHGVETEIKNPFDDPAMAIKKISVARAVGITLDSTGKPDGGTYTIMQPQIGWRPSGKPSGSVYVTVQYAPPLGEIGLTKNAVQAVASGASPPVTWEVETYKRGRLSHDNSVNSDQIVAIESGSLLVTWQLAFANRTPVAGDGVGGFWTVDGVDVRYGAIRVGSQSSGADEAGNAVVIPVTAGSYISLAARQSNLAALSRNLQSGVTGQVCRTDIRYVAPDPSTTARVTLLFQGA